MRDHIMIGSTPAGEDCAQVGTADYHQIARRECRAFIGQIRREFGPEPDGARLFTKSNPHDFGTYYEVACEFETDGADEFDETNVEQIKPTTAYEYALKCEDTSDRWDPQALVELRATPK